MGSTDKESIKQVIEEAYIQGIHQTQDEGLIKRGFHPDFEMLVLQNDEINKVNVNQWLARIETLKADNPTVWRSKTTHNFLLIDITGPAAVAKLEVYRRETLFATDYMLLYKFQDGWKIVSKIFVSPS